MQVVSLHCALDEKTKHLADKKMLGLMKEDAILINAARGPIHHEEDLVAHLKANPNFRSAAFATGLNVSQRSTQASVPRHAMYTFLCHDNFRHLMKRPIKATGATGQEVTGRIREYWGRHAPGHDIGEGGTSAAALYPAPAA